MFVPMIYKKNDFINLVLHGGHTWFIGQGAQLVVFEPNKYLATRVKFRKTVMIVNIFFIFEGSLSSFESNISWNIFYGFCLGKV